MRRRDFISYCGLAIAGFRLDPERLLWTPGPVYDGSRWTALHQCGVLVDHGAKTIKLTQPITVRQMMATLIDAWDEPDRLIEESPVLTAAPEIAMMNDGWRVEEASIAHLLSRGSVHQGKDIWSSLHWPKDVDSLREWGKNWPPPQKTRDAIKAHVASVTMWA